MSPRDEPHPPPVLQPARRAGHPLGSKLRYLGLRGTRGHSRTRHSPRLHPQLKKVVGEQNPPHPGHALCPAPGVIGASDEKGGDVDGKPRRDRPAATVLDRHLRHQRCRAVEYVPVSRWAQSCTSLQEKRRVEVVGVHGIVDQREEADRSVVYKTARRAPSPSAVTGG